MQYILGTNGFTFFFNGRPKRIEKGTTQYAKILKAFDMPISQQDSIIADILNGDQLAVKEAEKEGFSFIGDKVFVDGELLPKVLIDKINSLKKEGLPITLFLPFWRELRQNPDYAVVNDRGLYDFLSYRELPISEDGCIIAYKGINSNGWSVSGNTETKVIKGKVNKAGQIYNGVGEEVEIVRNQVTTDRSVHCHRNSLHIGSLDYARGWGSQVVIVKINPRDVVSVAGDCECQKMRVCKYKVIGRLTEEILAPATNSKGEAIQEQSKIDQNKFEQRILGYLQKKAEQNNKEVSIKAIRNIFSPEYPDEKRVLTAVSSLDYFWYVKGGVKTVGL